MGHSKVLDTNGLYLGVVEAYELHENGMIHGERGTVESGRAFVEDGAITSGILSRSILADHVWLPSRVSGGAYPHCLFSSSAFFFLSMSLYISSSRSLNLNITSTDAVNSNIGDSPPYERNQFACLCSQQYQP